MKASIPDKRAAALRATLELISEHGFHGAPMSQIANRAHIGVGTIYRYFPSKDHLINALYLEMKTHITGEILRNYSRDTSVLESFRQLLKDVIRYFIENSAELSFLEQYENSPLITAATREEGLRIAEPIIDLFHRATEQQLLKELPFEVLGSLINGAIIALVKLELSNKVKMDEPSLTASIDAIWDMIKR